MEMKRKTLITDIEKRYDKKQQDYWLIRTKLAEKSLTYLAFSTDYNLSSQALSLLTNYPHRLVNQMALLTIQKRASDVLEKVIAIELEK